MIKSFLVLISFVLAFAMATVDVTAQIGGAGLDIEKLSAKSQGLTSLLTAEQVPTDNPVDPEFYVVGPGDVFSYVSSGFDFSEKITSVTPENTLFIERIGSFNVKGLTIKEVRALLAEKMAKRSTDVEIMLSLRRPRLVYVSLQGNVPFPGTYSVPASMRVSTFLELCRQPWLIRKDQAVGEQLRSSGGSVENTRVSQLSKTTGSELSPYAARNIVVTHREGISYVDLPKSRLSEFSYLDPHLREGDAVSVPYDAISPSTIMISGAVARTTTLSFKLGDRASVLLAAAGGPTQDADLSRIVLILGGGQGKVNLQVDKNFRLVADDPVLQPGSSIIVEGQVLAGAKPTQGVVEVFGEVVTVGSVVITPGVTRLNQVLEMSGGITTRAALPLSYVVRPERTANSLREVRDEANRRFMYSDLQLEDTLRYNLDQSYKPPYVSCDFVTALKDTASVDNIVMQSGDVVVIPQIPDRVYVYGQVMNPGFVGIQPGKRLEWYVERAGGYASGAKPGRARIIKGKSKTWVEDASNVFVEPGDEVYVPRAPDIPAGVELQTWAIVAGMLSSLAALSATMIAILR